MVDDRLVAAMATDFGMAVVALLRHFLGSVKGSLWASGSLVDTILHFCYNKPLVRIRNDHFYYGPNREPVLLGVDGCRIQGSRSQGSGLVGLRVFGGSFWGLPYRILNMNHKRELLRGLWVWQVVRT